MSGGRNHVDLGAIARATLLRFGFLVDAPAEALAEAARLNEPNFASGGGQPGLKDLSGWLWSSIDNDDSRDLDQIEYIDAGRDGTRLYVAIADLESFVGRGDPLDRAAQHNTTSIYTGVHTFPLFPDRLSTNLTSLVENQKRLAVVVEMHFSGNGELEESSVYRAVVQNQAQLTYRAVGAWLDHVPNRNSAVSARVLNKIEASAALQQQLRQQRELADILCGRRRELGALTLETIEVRPELTPQGQWELQPATRNAATQLIEDFMIAANQATVSYLNQRGCPTLHRVVRVPKNWPEIVRLAAGHGEKLPTQPDSVALEGFLTRQRQKDPDRFPDLSLAVIKLLGRGEYVVAGCKGEAPGHFALAVEGYAHTTAPNRRYPDIITQRLLCAALAGQPQAYSESELSGLVQHCTEKEGDAKKAERSVHKSIAAAAMSGRIGESFEGIITGASEKGVWARLRHPLVEGRVHGATPGIAVGDRVRVKLVLADPWRGFIDFDLLDRLPRN
jgi:VacB/RNase II family 3'-5' exoribonuclease